jgi:putative addiction module CopG family antidote
MTVSTPLPPELKQFVCEQLASGVFQSESEVLFAALRLLRQRSTSHATSAQRTLHGPGQPSDDALSRSMSTNPGARRSPRGILADLRSHISLDDIKEARSETWSGLSRGPS